jgi:predicted RNA-binding protein with TRAM domain
MELSDQLRSLFSERVEEQDGSYVVEIPKREIELGTIDEGQTYRVAMMDATSADENSEKNSEPEQEREREQESVHGPPKPPVEEGEHRDVEIEDLGEQGDGITRVERGFVVIVPDTDQGERVTVEITDVRENVAFAEVVERLSYYE